MRSTQPIAALALAACTAAQPAEPPPPERVVAARPTAPRAAPKHAWKQQHGRSVLAFDGKRELAVSLTAKATDGVYRAVLDVRAIDGTRATIAVSGARARLESSERVEVPLDLPLAKVTLADALDANRRVELGADLEITLDGHQPITTRVPPQPVKHVAQAIFASAGNGPIRFAGEPDRERPRRETMLVTKLPVLSSRGSGTTLGDVDLVATELQRVDGEMRCPGFGIAFVRKPSDVIVRDRRTGTEVARRTFAAQCPGYLTYTVGGVARAYASSAAIDGWLRAFVGSR